MNIEWKPIVMVYRVCVLGILVACLGVRGNPTIPGEVPKGPIALVGGSVFPISSPPIEGGMVVMDRGRIVAVGKAVDLPESAEVVDVTGLSIYPGLFNTDGLLGLIEVNSVRATKDFAETGRINPNVRVEVAVNPDSELLPVTRSGGVLLNLTTPQGGLVSGMSAVLRMDGWTWEDMTLKSGAGLHINWPRLPGRSSDDSGDGAKNKELPAILELRELFDDAKAYRDQKRVSSSSASDLRLEALGPVLDREIPMIVTAESAEQIQSAISFAIEYSVRLIIYGGYDAEACAPLLKRHAVPVIVAGTHRLPRRRSDPYDAPFTLPNRLRLAGVQFCIAANDSFSAPNIRNLPYNAAHAVAYGLPHDEGLKAITLYPAQIMGVEKHVGSLEVGKEATLIVTDGDPLETATHVVQAYIQGAPVDLSDRHKVLWKKYRERLRRLGLTRGE